MGLLLCLLSAAAFGAMGVFGKLAYAAGVTPEALVLVRFTVAALLLTAIVLGRRAAAGPGSPAVAALRLPPWRVTLLAVGGLGAVGYATQASLYFAALELMDASLLVIIYYTYPALVTVAAVALGRERLTARKVLALSVATGGTLLVLAGAVGSALHPVGVALGLGVAVTYTAYILVSDRVVGRLDPVLLAALVMTGASLSVGARSALTGGPDLSFDPVGWLWLAAIAVVSTVVAMVSFFAGMRLTGPSTAAIVSTFEPVVTTALAAVTLHEAPTAVQLGGGLLVLASVVVLQLRPRTRPTTLTRVAPVPVRLTAQT